MSIQPTTEQVRVTALELLERHGASADQPLEETIMVRDGHYIGRRFRRGDLSALWQINTDSIDLYDATHHLATHPLTPSSPQKQAA